MRNEMTEFQKRALAVAPTIRKDGLFTCTMLGEALFAAKRFEGWKCYPEDTQRFARSGGKVIKALRDLGLVEPDYTVKDDRRLFYRVARK